MTSCTAAVATTPSAPKGAMTSFLEMQAMTWSWAGSGQTRLKGAVATTYWWVGKKERVKDEKEPATFLVWAWTLGAVTDKEVREAVTAEFALQLARQRQVRAVGQIL